MPRYKTRNQIALANTFEGTHSITSKRKLEHAATENKYSEEPGVSQTSERNSKVKDIPSKDVNSQKKLTNSKRKWQQNSPSAKTNCEGNKSQINSSNSTPERMTPKEVLQLLDARKHKEKVLSSTNMKNCKFSLPNSNPDDLESQVPKILGHKQITPELKNFSRKYKTRTKIDSPYTREKEFQSASTMSSSVVTESSIPCAQESVKVISQIKNFAQTYSQAKHRPSKTYEKNEESHSLSVSTSPDIVEMIDIFNQVKQYCFKNKRVSSRKTKTQHIESETASLDSNTGGLETIIPCVEEPIEVTKHIKRVSQTYAGTKKILSTTCKRKSNYQNTSTNSCLNVTNTNDVTSQVKTDLCSTKRRKTKATLNLNTDDLEFNICNAEEPTDITPQIKHVARTYSRTTERLSKTLKKNDGSQSSSINLNLGITESKEYFPQGEQCGVKKYNTRNLSNIKRTNKSKNGLLNSYSDNFESKTDVQELDEVSPQIKQCAAKIHKRQSLANIKRKNENSLDLISDDFESSIADVQELNDEMSLQIKQHAAKKHNRQSLANVKRMNESKNTLLNSISDDCESSITDVQELNDEVSPQIKQRTAKKRKKQSLANRKPTNESKNGLLNSISDNCESSIADVQELNDEVSPQIKQCAVKNRKKQSLANRKLTDESKNGLLNSISDDCESSITDVQELNDEVSPQIKRAAKKRKKQSLANRKPMDESKNGLLNSISDDCESSIADVQELNVEVSPQIKPVTRKCKKVGFVSPCDELQTNSSNSTIDVLDSEMPMDFLPIITESCENRLKSIVSTAVQIQRHSQRRILTETDFIKALMFHNYFENDITEHEIDSEILEMNLYH